MDSERGILGLIGASSRPGQVGRRHLGFAGGRPLLGFTLDAMACSGVVDRAVVWTDDDEVAGWCAIHGVEVFPHRSNAGAADGVAEATLHLARSIGWRGPAGWFDPAWPLLSASSIRRAVDQLEETEVDTIAAQASPGGSSALQLARWNWLEDGRTRSGARHGVFHLPKDECIEVASFDDLAALRRRLEQGRVVLRLRANARVGSGHLFHCLQLAEELADQEIRFLLVDCDPFVASLLRSRGHPFIAEGDLAEDLAHLAGPGRNLIVNDVLDTTEQEVLAAKAAGYLVVNIEDLGPGARFADWVINALYPPKAGQASTVLSGARYATLRSEFRGLPPKEVRKRPERLLVTFGGTDPAGLAERFANSLRRAVPEEVDVVVILGLGAREVSLDPGCVVQRSVPSMAAAMMRADLIVTSAGRTVYEAAATGTPVVVIAQNAREATHAHIGYDSGVVFLGVGPLVDEDHAVSVVCRLLADQPLREELSGRLRSSIDHLGTERIAAKIRDSLKGL